MFPGVKLLMTLSPHVPTPPSYTLSVEFFPSVRWLGTLHLSDGFNTILGLIQSFYSHTISLLLFIHFRRVADTEVYVCVPSYLLLIYNYLVSNTRSSIDCLVLFVPWLLINLPHHQSRPSPQPLFHCRPTSSRFPSNLIRSKLFSNLPTSKPPFPSSIL